MEETYERKIDMQGTQLPIQNVKPTDNGGPHTLFTHDSPGELPSRELRVLGDECIRVSFFAGF